MHVCGQEEKTQEGSGLGGYLDKMCRRWRGTACKVPADGLGLESREEERKPGWVRRQDKVEDSD